jgi:hypothetical protein
MYIMYVDESGDPGLASQSRHFALTGLVVHESRWRDLITHLMQFRRSIKAAHGLPMRSEIHASQYLRSSPVDGMEKHIRLAILRNMLDELAKIDFISITSVVTEKDNKQADYDVFGNTWKTLFQRFENTMRYGNFPGGHSNDHGMLIVDNTDGKKLSHLVRKMSVYNMVPSINGGAARNLPLLKIIEDPHLKDSANSLLIQACDVAAFFLHQRFAPNGYVRKKYANRYYDRLGPILNRKASNTHPLGIVIL